MKLIVLVGLCVFHAVFTSESLHHERRNTRRESRKLFGGYRITPKYCKPTRKITSKLDGPSICMFNHECSQRNGEVVGACMDGFLFGACCRLPEGSAGELINSYSNLVSTPKISISSRPISSTTNAPQSTWALGHTDIMLSGMTQITDSLLNDKIMPTAQDDAVVQVGDVHDQFSTPGIQHPSPENLIENYDTSNDINPNDFQQISSAIQMEDRKTTHAIEDTTADYYSASSPLIQISISNGPELFTSSPTYLKPIYQPNPSSNPNENDKYVLIPTISHTVRPNKTGEFNSIVNIIQMLNESSTQTSYPTTYGYTQYSTTKKPPSTSYIFNLTPSRRPGHPSSYTQSSTAKPPSTSYVYSSTITPRPTSKSPPTRKKLTRKPTTKPTPKPKPSSSTLYVYPPPTTKPPGYFLYSTVRPGHSTYASTPGAFGTTTKRPPSTSYVFSSSITKRPTATASTVNPGYSVYTNDPFSPSSTYGSSTASSNTYSSPPPTIIVLSPSTESPSSAGSTLYTTSTPQKRRPVAQVTITNHVTHNLYSTEGPSPTVLITPKPSSSTSKPIRRPTTEYLTLPAESETSVNDFINFPPVRNPNLNISSSVLEDEITTPTFIEDEELNFKMESFVNKIVEGLQEPFQGLKEVVYKRNSSVFVEQPTKKPTKKPNTTKKPVSRPGTNTRITTKKPPTKKPTQITTKRPVSTSKKPTPVKKTATTVSYIDTHTSTFPSDDYRHVCGIRPLVKTGRIVGGKGAQFGEFPWQVLVRESTWLGLFTKNKCGGVLISNRYVMTAAHCQPGFLASLVAVFGEHDISGERESKRAVSRNVKRVIVHRQYDASTFENDLALLELEHPITFDEHIVPICLPREGEDFTGRMATVTGWGRLKYGGGVPSVLQEVQVPIMENHVCQEMFRTAGHSKIIMESFLCAGYANGQKDSCEGDSGGPLVLQRPDGRYQLAGTVSHGIKCAAPYLPGVYMRTAFYKPWIESITGVH